MSSFSCPYLNEKEKTCQRLQTECVPGRKGCVLKNRFQFAFPVEEIINQKKQKEKIKVKIKQ